VNGIVQPGMVSRDYIGNSLDLNIILSPPSPTAVLVPFAKDLTVFVLI
jgi:hypothetical protein